MRTFIDVTINGVKVPSYEVSVSFGVDQISGDMQISVRNRPAWLQDNMSIDIWGGSTQSSGLIARGFTSGLSRDFSATSCVNPDTIVGTNNGAYLQMPWGDPPKIYGSAASNPQTDGSIVQNIVESMGIDSSLTHIEDAGIDLGTVQPITWNTGDAGYSIIQKIDEAAGYLTYCDKANVMRRVQWNGIPTTNGAYTFEEGGRLRSMSHTHSISGIFNKVVVEGLQIEDEVITAEASAPSPYIPTPPTYISTTVSNDYIETVEHATAVAQYTLNRLNRPVEQYSVTVDGTFDISPGMTVTINNPTKGIYAESFYVWHVDHRITMDSNGEGDFETSMTLIGGYASDIEIEYLPPVIQLAISSFREYIDGTGAITTVVCDASGSYDPDGSIVQYEWSVSTGTPSSAVTTTPYFSFYVDDSVTSVDVTVIATDSTAVTAELTQTHTINVSELVSETIWAISATKAYVTLDGGETFNEYTFPSGTGTALARYSGSWGQMFGTSTGHVYVSQHYLDDPQDTQPHDSTAVDAIWITEQVETKRGWVAFHDGAVYLTDDAGASWNPRGTIPGSGTVYDIQEAVGGTGTLHAARGDSVYRSYDEGINWESILTVSGSTIRQMAFGFERYFAVANGGANYGVYDLDTGELVTADASISSAVSMTVGWKTPYLLLANSNGRVGISDFTATTLLDYTNGTPSMIVRSGNEEGIVYAATDHGIEKSVDYGATFFESMLTSQVITQVGFGPVAEPENDHDGYIYIPGDTSFFYASPGASSWNEVARPSFWNANNIKVWRVEPSTTNGDTLILSSEGYPIVSNGTSIVGSTGGPSPLAMTFDHGDTWVELVLPIPDGSTTKSGEFFAISYPVWHPTISGLWAVIGRHRTSGDVDKSYVWFGSTTVQGDGTYITHSYSYTRTTDLEGSTLYSAHFGNSTELLVADGTFNTIAGWIKREDGLFNKTIRRNISPPYGIGQNFFVSEAGSSRVAYTMTEGQGRLWKIPDYHTYYTTTASLIATSIYMSGEDYDPNNPDVLMPMVNGIYFQDNAVLSIISGTDAVPVERDGSTILCKDATYDRATRKYIGFLIKLDNTNGDCYLYNVETGEFSQKVNATLPIAALYVEDMTINMLKG